MKTTLFIPVLNEIDGVKVIMPCIQKDWVDEILFVDGGSTDGTVEYLRQEGYTVISQRKPGLCQAYWECFEVCKGDIIIPFSPDGNSVPELIPALVAKIKEGYDLVIVSRYLDDSKSEDDDFITGWGNWLFPRLVKWLYGGSFTDVFVMFRAFRKDLVKTLGFDETQLPTLEVIMVIRAIKHRLKVAEIPGPEPKRIGGVRKMKIWYNGSAVMYQLIKELFVHRVK